MKKNLIYSILGVLFQTLFPLIVYPYITRVLGVSNLGEYNFYASTVSYLAVFSGFGISLYGTKEIGRLKDNRSSYSRVFGELVTFNILTSLLVYLFIFILIAFSGKYPNTKLFLITSITIIGNAIGAEFFFVALERQKYLLIRNIAFKLLSLVLIFFLVKDEGDLLTYAIIMLVSTAGVSITNIVSYHRMIEWKAIKIKEFHLAPYVMPLLQVFLIDALIHYYGMMDIVVLGNLDSIESVGYYSVASKIYALSFSFLTATAVPLLPRVSYYLGKGLMVEYENLIQKCFDIYVLFIGFVTFILFFYSEEIVSLIAGEAFVLSSLPLKLLSLTLFFSTMCNCFIFQVFYPNNKTGKVLVSQTVGIVTNVVLSFLLIPRFSYNGAALAFLASYFFLFASMVILGKKLIPQFTGTKDLLKDVVAILICIATALLLKNLGVHFLLSICVCSVVYCLFGMMTKNATLLYLYNITVEKVKSIIYESNS